jgi:hypothetical protein
LGAVADDDRSRIDLAQRAYQDIEALVTHEPAGSDDQTAMCRAKPLNFGLLTLAEVRPVVRVNAKRNDNAPFHVLLQKR